MGVQQIPTVGASELASTFATAFTAPKLRLVNAPYVPNPNDTLASLEAIECTFSGYTAGGYAAALGTPFIWPGGGVIAPTPQVEVAFVPPGTGTPVTGVVGGWFLADATDGLIASGSFTTPVPLSQAGDGFPITVGLIFGALGLVAVCWVYGQLN